MFINGLNTNLPLQAELKRPVHGVGTHKLSGKEKVPGTAVNKEDHGDMKRSVTIDFLEKSAIINSASYC